MAVFSRESIDLETDTLIDVINEIDSSDSYPNVLSVRIPLYSIGSTNDHLDICEDLIDASYILEEMATYATNVDLRKFKDEKSPYRVGFLLEAAGCKPAFFRALRSACIHFGGNEIEIQERLGHEFETYADRMEDYRDSLDERDLVFPMVIEDYQANLINGAYYTYEETEWVQRDLLRYPERVFGFGKSPYSKRLGGDAYASADSWIISNDVDVDAYFKLTNQKLKVSGFISAEIFLIENIGIVKAENLLAYFPIDHLLKARICTAFFDDKSKVMNVGNLEDAFTHSIMLEYLRRFSSSDFLRQRKPKECFLHESGEVILFKDEDWSYLLYETRLLNLPEIKKLNENLGNLFSEITELIGVSQSSSCSWATLNDEQFERLCYDIIYAHPAFDEDTIRKMGNSRSRDGGRDIVVWTKESRQSEKAKKFVFQCKLISGGRSLGKRGLTDIGDMLDQYDAQGFGVMTSAPIDATLYDAIDAICTKRGIEQKHFSLFEIERYLNRHPSIMRKYFST